MAEKALDLYNRSSRLDIDDYNNEVHEGLHITSMAGSCLSVLEGFGGMRIIENKLHFNPTLPEAWDSIKFHTRFRGRLLFVETSGEGTQIKLVGGEKIEVYLNGDLLVLN